jgi:predicted anti-sigma-YlaC factor YlaD
MVTRAAFLSAALGLSLAVLSSCSINQLAVRAVAGVLANGQSTVFSGDDDPDLVGAALPFALKTYESLLEADPQNAALAIATAKAFVSYAYAFVQTPAVELPEGSADEQRALLLRTKGLYLRARSYALRALEVRHPGFGAALSGSTAAAALALATRDDSDALYWAGAAWLAAFSADPFDFDQIYSVPRAVALLQQVLAWDPGYGAGAVQELLISFYGAAPADLGGSADKARASFTAAVALAGGKRAGPYVSLATAVSVKKQDLAEFRDLLRQALAVDVNADPANRLVNIINQRKAQWLLDHADSFFIDAEEAP